MTWLVTSGDYSSYTPHFTCATAQLAEAAVEQLNRYSGYVEYACEEVPDLASIDDLRLTITHHLAIEYLDGNTTERSYTSVNFALPGQADSPQPPAHAYGGDTSYNSGPLSKPPQRRTRVFANGSGPDAAEVSKLTRERFAIECSKAGIV